jgi:hypothetical protein
MVDAWSGMLSTAASFATACREASKSERHPLSIACRNVRPIRKAVLAPARGFETGLDFFVLLACLTNAELIHP